MHSTTQSKCNFKPAITVLGSLRIPSENTLAVWPCRYIEAGRLHLPDKVMIIQVLLAMPVCAMLCCWTFLRGALKLLVKLSVLYLGMAQEIGILAELGIA